MVRTLATCAPDELRAPWLYRPVEWLSELGARSTVAGVTCLERQGSLSSAERTTMLRSQGQLLGWPSDWHRSVGGATWSG